MNLTDMKIPHFFSSGELVIEMPNDWWDTQNAGSRECKSYKLLAHWTVESW